MKHIEDTRREHPWRSMPIYRNGRLAVRGGRLTTPAQAADKLREMNIGGYLSVGHSQAPASFNAGYSIYTAAWPLVEKYQGHQFQSGLYGTWMCASMTVCACQTLFRHRRRSRLVDVTRLSHRDAEVHHGRRGTEFLCNRKRSRARRGLERSTRSLWRGPAQPAAALPHRRSECSPRCVRPAFRLRLSRAAAAAGEGHYGRAKVPTGDHSWTLFLSTKNFKGPVAFFTPYFWSHTTVKNLQWAGKLLDSRPCQPNKPISMETRIYPPRSSRRKGGVVLAPRPRCSPSMRMATPC